MKAVMIGPMSINNYWAGQKVRSGFAIKNPSELFGQTNTIAIMILTASSQHAGA